jgi:hypothetical protein
MVATWYLGTAITPLVSYQKRKASLESRLTFDDSWNSAIFSTLEANQYEMFVVPRNFNTSDEFQCDLVDGCDRAKMLWSKSRVPGGLEVLDNAACISKYSANFITGRRNVFAVTSNTTRGWQETPNSGIGWQPSNETLRNDSTIFGVIKSRQFDVSVGAGRTWDPTYWWCPYGVGACNGSSVGAYGGCVNPSGDLSSPEQFTSPVSCSFCTDPPAFGKSSNSNGCVNFQIA